MATPQALNWGAEALWQQLLPLLPGLSVEVLAHCSSTNSLLLERARGRRQADAQPCLLVAEHQTQGRGRQGKTWLSSAGSSLTFSLGLPLAPADWSGLSLAVGLAIADTLDPLLAGQAPRLGIKWPNDLLLLDAPAGAEAPRAPAQPPGRKLGGILIETVQSGAQRLAVVGVGLNLQPQPVAGLSWGYACLQELQPGLTAPAVLARVAEPLVQALRAFERDGFAPLQARFAGRDVLAGCAVTTSLPDQPRGIADGVDSSGTLWLRRDDGQRVAVHSGEVSLRLDGAGPGPAPPGTGAPVC